MRCPACEGYRNDRRMVPVAPPPRVENRVGPGNEPVRYGTSYAPCADFFHGIQEPAKVEEARTNNPGGHDLRRDTMIWIDEHPMAAELFLTYAREVAAARKARGSKKPFGVKYLMERVRYQCDIVGWNEQEYLLNNNMTPYLGRWLVQREPALKPFLKFRKVRYTAPLGNALIEIDAREDE